MATLTWGQPEARTYESGLDRVVLYVDGEPGVVWNGVQGIAVSPNGGVARPYYIDGVKYLNLASAEEPEFNLTAFSSPEPFDKCDGGVAPHAGALVWQQMRKSFGFSFRTRVGNSINGALGYKIHVVHNALADPSGSTHPTLADSVDPESLSWSITTRNIEFPGFHPVSYFTIDSTKTQQAFVGYVEDILYGTISSEPRLLTPFDILAYDPGRYDSALYGSSVFA